jgi:hypothetical protein
MNRCLRYEISFMYNYLFNFVCETHDYSHCQHTKFNNSAASAVDIEPFDEASSPSECMAGVAEDENFDTVRAH